MSKTPRTDEHILHHGNGNWHPSAFVLASFARQIETELAEAEKKVFAYKTALELSESELIDARAEIERLRARNAILDNAIAEMTEEQSALCAEGQTITELVAAKDKLIEQLKLALKTLRKYPHTYKMTGRSSIVVDKDIEQCNAALLAAERGK